jgi:hypothetical protein
MDFVSAGKAIAFPISVTAPGGTFRLGDALNATNTAMTVSNGTFDANNYNITIGSFSSTGSFTRTVTMGSGLWTLNSTAGTIWQVGATGLTFNKNTANILITQNGTNTQSFNGGGLSYNKLTLSGTGIGFFNFTATTAGTSFTEFASTKTVAHTITLAQANGLGTIDTWSITGTPGNVVTINSNVVGTRRNFTLTNITSGIDYLAVQDIGELSNNKFYVGLNSVNNGNNLNVYFSNPGSLTATGNMFMLF